MLALIEGTVYDIPAEKIAEWVTNTPNFKAAYDVTLEKYLTDNNLKKVIEARGGMLQSEFIAFVNENTFEHMKIRTNCIRYQYAELGKEAFLEYKTDMTEKEMTELAMSPGKYAYDTSQDAILNDGSGFTKQ